jgi:hypothetical protein
MKNVILAIMAISMIACGKVGPAALVANDTTGPTGPTGPQGPTGPAGTSVSSQKTCIYSTGVGAANQVYNYQRTNFADGSQLISCNYNHTISNTEFVTAAGVVANGDVCVVGNEMESVVGFPQMLFEPNGTGGFQVYSYPAGVQTTVTGAMTCNDTTTTAVGYLF